MATKTAKETIKNPEVVSRRRFIRFTPDKMRNATYLINKKKATDALSIMKFSNLAAARPIILALKNAMAIAKDRDLIEENLFVSRIFVDEGPKLKRRRIIHQGKATAILKRMSHITVVLTAAGNQKSEILNSPLGIQQKPKVKK